MFLRLFKTTQPLPLVLLVILAIAMRVVTFLHYYRVVEPNGMPLYDLVLYLMHGMPLFIYAIVGFILTTSQAIHLNRVLNKHEVLYKQSWIPALLYVLIVALLPPFLWFHPLLFVNSILIFALDKIFSLYKNQNVLSMDFDSCLLLSLSALFYLPAIVLFLIYILAIIILRPFSWRDWVVGVMGFVLPFFFAFTYYFLIDGLQGFYERVFITGIKKQIDLHHIFTYQYTFSLAMTGVLFVLAFLRLQSNYYKNVMKARLIQQLLLLLMLIGLISVLVSRDEELYRFNILAIPVSVFLGYYFLSGKKQWLSEVVFLVLVGSWVYNFFLS